MKCVDHGGSRVQGTETNGDSEPKEMVLQEGEGMRGPCPIPGVASLAMVIVPPAPRSPYVTSCRFPLCVRRVYSTKSFSACTDTIYSHDLLSQHVVSRHDAVHCRKQLMSQNTWKVVIRVAAPIYGATHQHPPVPAIAVLYWGRRHVLSVNCDFTMSQL